MKRDLEFFEATELELVHVSRRLNEALGVEELLDGHGVDYVVEADKYRATILYILPTERVGAFFWVPASDAERVRSFLTEQGITATRPEEEPR